MAKKDRDLLRKIILDFICFGIVALPKLLFKLYGEPHIRGFFCNDETISYPYTIEGSTVPKPVLYFMGIGVPLILIAITEYILTKENYERSSKKIAGLNISPWLWECYKVIGVFLFGMACSHLTTDITKHVIGRLRPQFMDVCRPNVNCSLPENQHRYIDDYTCSGTNDAEIKQMRLSFMSGHSSFSAYAMVFLCMYIYARWTWRGSKLLRHLVQFGAFLFAWFTSISRVSDHKHHWSDVFVGSMQGTIMAVLIVLFVSEIFSKQSRTNIATPTDTNVVLLPQTAPKNVVT